MYSDIDPVKSRQCFFYYTTVTAFRKTENNASLEKKQRETSVEPCETSGIVKYGTGLIILYVGQQ